jgi:hypothetical protein
MARPVTTRPVHVGARVPLAEYQAMVATLGTLTESAFIRRAIASRVNQIAAAKARRAKR